MSDTPTPPTPGPADALGPQATPMPLPPPVPQAVATPRNRARTGTIVGVVVGVVIGGGAVAGLLNALGNDDAAAAPSDLEVTPPAPTAPSVPGAGSVGTPITLPGPGVEAPVTTTPSEPAPDDTTPDITAPSITSPPSTAPPETQPPAAVGDIVQMGQGVAFSLPAGWELLSADEDSAEFTNGTTAVYVVISASQSASELLFDYQSFLDGAVSGLEVGDVSPGEVYSNVVVDAAKFSYRAYVGQGQSGSTAVNGVVFGDVRYDGVGIVTDVMWVPTGSGEIAESDAAGLNAFFASFVYGS